MKSRAIEDNQITFENSYYKSKGEGRLDGRIWCGVYVKGKVSVAIKLKSVTTITSVLFQSLKGWRYFDASKVRFLYFYADGAAAGRGIIATKVTIPLYFHGFERFFSPFRETFPPVEKLTHNI